MKKIPKWIQRELDDPASEGDRNQQMIRVGPSLIRDCGFTLDSLVELFQGMFPDLSEGEVVATCRSAARYAAQGGRDQVSKSEYIAMRRRFSGVEARTARQLPGILADYPWTLGEIACAGGNLEEMAGIEQRRLFLSAMFNADDVIWIGNVYQSGEREKNGRIQSFKHHFKTRDEWLAQPTIRGEFTSHCTFLSGAISRCAETVSNHRYLVVESDRLTLDGSGAVFNWLATEQNFNLRAVVFSGGKSIHGWFDWPATIAFDELCAILRGLSCDPATPRPSQPVRCPGCVRRDTKKLQSLLLLT